MQEGLQGKACSKVALARKDYGRSVLGGLGQDKYQGKAPKVALGRKHNR